MSAQSTHPEPPLNPITPISWEGDKMFNIYIHDYCSKRGFRKTARELMQEAEIAADAAPPINARQGLLFEWWSVFWVLFQAKSNGGGSEDGLVYIHHQAAQRQRLATANQMPAPLPIGNQPSQPPQLPQQQPPINRLPNGIPQNNVQPGMQRPTSTYLTNGTIPNGVGMNPAMGGQPQPQPGQPIPPGATMNFGGMGPHSQQPNGMSSAGPGPVGPPQQQQPPQGISSQPMPFGMPQNQQRPQSMMNGMSPQPRGPPNGGPFHGSPTMAHSPQHNAGTPGHSAQPGQSQPGQPGHPQGGPGQPAMSQLGGPSPHMAPMNRAGGMMPPNGGPPGMSPMNNGQPQLQQQGPPTPGYQHQPPPNQGGRPPSRTTTPRGGMMTNPSPSFAARQTPGGPLGMGPAGPSSMGMAGGMGGNNGMVASADQMNQEIMQIPQNILNALKTENGYGDKDISNLTNQEKHRIVIAWRARQQQKPPGMMSAPGQPGQSQQRPGQPSQQRTKRSSTSPSEEHETLPRNESSPPDRKRVRRSPGEPSGLGPMPYSTPPLPGQQQPGPPGQPPMGQQPMLMMRGSGGMMNGGMAMGVGGPGGGPPPPQQQQHAGLQPPQIGGPPGGMPPAMMQMGHGPGSMMSPQQQMHQQASQQAQQQAQQQQQAQHQAAQQQFLRMQKPGPSSELTFNPAAPAGSAPPFNRMQNKPSMSSMMPPPSPAINGPPKDTKPDMNNGNKPPGSNPPPNGQQQSSLNPDGSPRNQPGGPSGSGTAPPTPVPGNQSIPQQQQPQQPPPPPSHSNMMQTSILGMAPSGSGLGPGDMNLFDNAFMDIGSEFDPSTLFRPDGDINFERDFGQWFNPDDTVMGASLDMK